MRFITEFELASLKEEVVNAYKSRGDFELGQLISDSFSYTEKPLHGKTRWSLEIEAFPTDKWVEFKQRLFSEIATCNDTDFPVDGARILSWIKELESFGKPSGDAK